jgi:hypothetical protein
MTLISSRRLIRVAGLSLVLGCEMVAPLKALPDGDSAVSGRGGGVAAEGARASEGASRRAAPPALRVSGEA